MLVERRAQGLNQGETDNACSPRRTAFRNAARESHSDGRAITSKRERCQHRGRVRETRQGLRARFRPSMSTEKPKAVNAAAMPRVDGEAPTSHLQLGLARSARAIAGEKPIAKIADTSNIDVRMGQVDVKIERLSSK